MTITDNLKELAADLLHSGASIQEVADQLSLPLKDAEYLCFLLCRQQPEDFNINDYLTKEWLEEKLGSHSIIEIANLTGLRYRQVQYYLRKYGLSARSNTISENTACPPERAPNPNCWRNRNCAGCM